MEEPTAVKKRYKGSTVVLVAVAITFGGFAAGYVIYLGLNPPADLFLRLEADCQRNATACEALFWVELPAASVTNLTLLSRSLDAFDHPEDYPRAEKNGENLTMHTAKEPARQLLQYLGRQLAADHPGQAPDGTWDGPILLRHRDATHDRVFRLWMST